MIKNNIKYINENVSWSNWEPISYEDIISTYDILKETNINPSIKSILQNILKTIWGDL